MAMHTLMSVAKLNHLGSQKRTCFYNKFYRHPTLIISIPVSVAMCVGVAFGSTAGDGVSPKGVL